MVYGGQWCSLVFLRMRATHQQKGSVTARQKVEGHGPQSLDRPGQEGAEKYVPDMTPELFDPAPGPTPTPPPKGEIRDTP